MPVARTEATLATAATELFTLADAKNVIGMELEQVDRDAWLVQLIAQAQAVVEESTGLRLADAPGARAEYVLDDETRVLAIDASDVASIIGVAQFDADGTTTTLNAAEYDVRLADGRTYIVRNDDECFPASYDGGLSAVITYAVGVDANSGRADLVKAAMGHVVASLYDGKGTRAEMDFRTNPDYTRVVRLLRSQQAVA